MKKLCSYIFLKASLIKNKSLYSLFIIIFTNLLSIFSLAEYQRDINLEWDLVEGATKYEIKLTFLDKENKEKVITLKESKWNDKLPVGHYKMQIRSFDQRNVPGDWSKSVDFNVKPALVKIKTPLNKEKIKSEEKETHEVLFSWEPIEDAIGYEIKILSKDKKTKIKETVDESEFKKNLPVAQLYAWSVTAIFKNNERGEESKKINKFIIYGAKIENADIEEPDSKYVRELSWAPPEFASHYSYAIQELTKEKKWKTVLKKSRFKNSKINFPKNYEGGKYKLLVKSYGSLRQPSEMSEIEFDVASGDRTPAAAKTAELKESIEKPSGIYTIASYFLTKVNYFGRYLEEDSEARFEAIGGTGRLGLGYEPEISNIGYFGIIDMGGMTLGKANHTFSSLELHVTWTKYFQANQFRASGGLYHKELPFVYDDQNGSFLVTPVEAGGLHLGMQFWVPLSTKLGIQLQARGYMALPGNERAPNGNKIDESSSLQTGVLGSYRLSASTMGYMGYSYKKDILKFDPTVTGSTYDKNLIEMSGHYLNLKLEMSF